MVGFGGSGGLSLVCDVMGSGYFHGGWAVRGRLGVVGVLFGWLIGCSGYGFWFGRWLG